jgi:hypothetical protein
MYVTSLKPSLMSSIEEKRLLLILLVPSLLMELESLVFRVGSATCYVDIVTKVIR